MKYTLTSLKNLEQQVLQVGYEIRYEKGNFKTGSCLIRQQKVVVVNKFLNLEGKIQSLLDILKQIDTPSQ